MLSLIAAVEALSRAHCSSDFHRSPRQVFSHVGLSSNPKDRLPSDISQLSDFKPSSYPSEPLDSSETTSLSAIRTCVAARSCPRPAGAPDASGATIPSRFRAASNRAPLESSTFRSIAMVTHAAPTAAVHRIAESAPGSLRTTHVAPRLRPSETSRTWHAERLSHRSWPASPASTGRTGKGGSAQRPCRVAGTRQPNIMSGSRAQFRY